MKMKYLIFLTCFVFLGCNAEKQLEPTSTQGTETELPDWAMNWNQSNVDKNTMQFWAGWYSDLQTLKGDYEYKGLANKYCPRLHEFDMEKITAIYRESLNRLSPNQIVELYEGGDEKGRNGLIYPTVLALRLDLGSQELNWPQLKQRPAYKFFAKNIYDEMERQFSALEAKNGNSPDPDDGYWDSKPAYVQELIDASDKAHGR